MDMETTTNTKPATKTHAIRTLVARAARCAHATTIELYDGVKGCTACEAVLR